MEIHGKQVQLPLTCITIMPESEVVRKHSLAIACNAAVLGVHSLDLTTARLGTTPFKREIIKTQTES